jgi:hypothetical protein
MRKGFLKPAIKSINEKADLDIQLIEERLTDNPQSKVVSLVFNTIPLN